MFGLFDMMPPIKEPKKEKPIAAPAEGATGETALRVGSLVKTKLPKRRPFLDRAEQQLLDEELEYICGKEQVGKVVRVAPHSIVVDFVLSAADYKQIYPSPQLPVKAALEGEPAGSLSVELDSGLPLNRGGQSLKRTQVFEASDNSQSQLSSNQSPLSGHHGSPIPALPSSTSGSMMNVTSNSSNLGFVPMGEANFSNQSSDSSPAASLSQSAGLLGGNLSMGAGGGESATPLKTVSTGTFRVSDSESGSPTTLPNQEEGGGDTNITTTASSSGNTTTSNSMQSVLIPQQHDGGGSSNNSGGGAEGGEGVGGQGAYANSSSGMMMVEGVPTLTITALGDSSESGSPLAAPRRHEQQQQQQQVEIGGDGRPVRRVTTLPPNEMAESVNSRTSHPQTQQQPTSNIQQQTANAKAENSTTHTSGDDAEEMIFLRKTLPINYVFLVVSSLDSKRQDLIRSKFSQCDFEVASRMASEWVDEILAFEALDLTDTAFHYQRLAGEDEFSSSAATNSNSNSAKMTNGPPGSPGLNSHFGLEPNRLLEDGNNKPLWVTDMPPALVHFAGIGSTLASHLRSLRRRVTRHLLSWLYICCGMAKLQLGHGSTDPKSVISCGRRATMLDPYNARAYSILISTFHCTSQLDLSMQTINQCQAECPQPNREQCEWLKSLMLLDTVYRLYNPKLKPPGQRLRTSLEVTIPNVTEQPHHLGLAALQRFAPGETIMVEAPAIWIPFPNSAAATQQQQQAVTPSHLGIPGGSSTRRRSAIENPLSDGSPNASISGGEQNGGGGNDVGGPPEDDGGGFGGLFTILAPIGGGRAGESTSLYQGGGGGRNAGGLLSITTTSQGGTGIGGQSTSVSGLSITSNGSESAQPQCAHCGFILTNKSSISTTLKQNNFADLGVLFEKRYPTRNRCPCRNGDPISQEGEGEVKISDSTGSKCKLMFCSPICEEKAWKSWHRVNCLEGGLLTKSHQQSLKLACGAFGNTTDSGVHLFLRVSTMAFCHVENRLIDLGLDHNSPNINKVISEELNSFFESIPIVTKLNRAPGCQPIPAMNTIIHVLSCLSARSSKIALVYEPEFADSVLQTCILCHRVVTRCPVTSVLKAKPRQPNWSAQVASSFEVKMLCLFPVIGCALSPEQKLRAAGLSAGKKGDRKAMSAGDRSESLFSLASGSSFDDLRSEASDENDGGGDDGEQEAQEEVPNVVIESQAGDLGRGLFCLRCPDDSQGIEPKTDILPPLLS